MQPRLVPVARFIDWTEANMALGLLRTNGIDAVLHDGNLVSIDWPLAMAIGGVRVMVPQHQAGAATDILRDVAAGGFVHDAETQMPPAPGEDPAIERCPQCRGEDVFRPRSVISAVVGALFMAPILTPTRQRVCRTCGHEWRAVPVAS